MRLLTAIPLLALVGCGETHDACTGLACPALARVDVTTLSDPTQLEGLQLTACIGQRCSIGDLFNSPSFEVVVQLDGEVSAFALVGRQPSAGVKVQAQFDRADSLADGDVYTVTLTDRNDAIVVTRAWAATYSQSFPDGPDCNECIAADLAPRP